MTQNRSPEAIEALAEWESELLTGVSKPETEEQRQERIAQDKKREQENIVWTREFWERVDARFADLVSRGAYSPVEQDKVADYIQDFRADDYISCRRLDELAGLLFESFDWLNSGKDDPNELRVLCPTAQKPYPRKR